MVLSFLSICGGEKICNIIIYNKLVEGMDEKFVQEIKRLEITQDYHKAFLLCLENLKNPKIEADAKDMAYDLIKKYGKNVMERFGYGYRINLEYTIDENWLLDIAIACGYKEINRSNMPIAMFKSVPCIAFGRLLAKQKFGIGQNKNNTSTLYYHCGNFCDDFKMLGAVLEAIVK